MGGVCCCADKKAQSQITVINQKIQKVSTSSPGNQRKYQKLKEEGVQTSDIQGNTSPQPGLKFSSKNFVQNNTIGSLEYYKIGKVLGQGGFGTVSIVTHKTTGIERAMKMINKSKLNKKEQEQMFQELNILSEIDHPNIVKVFEHFQDEKYHYLISEYCQGGELFQKITTISPFTQQTAAGYMKQILSAITYCHVNQIVHRDLQPQNILFDSPDANSNLQVIDFGASTQFEISGQLTQRIGTPYYVSPQILSQNPYDQKCDVWSMGILMYILLCGYPPFFAQKDNELYEKIRKGKFQFDTDWDHISQEAKDLITKMLNVSPKERISAMQASAHPWITQNASVEILDDKIFKKLSQFNAKNQLKVAILQLTATQVSSQEDRDQIQQSFQSIDQNGDGMLSREELMQCYQQIIGDRLKAKQAVEAVFKELDVDDNGKIDYTEFLSATISVYQSMTKEKMEQAFQLIDTDGNGQITQNELSQMMGGLPINDKVWNDLLKDIDQNNDGMISHNEFIQIFLQQTDNKLLQV